MHMINLNMIFTRIVERMLEVIGLIVEPFEKLFRGFGKNLSIVT